MRNVEWPFVIFQGTQDTVTNAEGCVLFHQQARSQDKAYRVPTSQAPFIDSRVTFRTMHMI